MLFTKEKGCFFEFTDRFVENNHFFAPDFVLKTPVVVCSLGLDAVEFEMLNVYINLTNPKCRIEYTSLHTNVYHKSPMQMISFIFFHNFALEDVYEIFFIIKNNDFSFIALTVVP